MSFKPFNLSFTGQVNPKQQAVSISAHPGAILSPAKFFRKLVYLLRVLQRIFIFEQVRKKSGYKSIYLKKRFYQFYFSYQLMALFITVS